MSVRTLLAHHQFYWFGPNEVFLGQSTELGLLSDLEADGEAFEPEEFLGSRLVFPNLMAEAATEVEFPLTHSFYPAQRIFLIDSKKLGPGVWAPRLKTSEGQSSALSWEIDPLLIVESEALLEQAYRQQAEDELPQIPSLALSRDEVRDLTMKYFGYDALPLTFRLREVSIEQGEYTESTVRWVFSNVASDLRFLATFESVALAIRIQGNDPIFLENSLFAIETLHLEIRATVQRSRDPLDFARPARWPRAERVLRSEQGVDCTIAIERSGDDERWAVAYKRPSNRQLYFAISVPGFWPREFLSAVEDFAQSLGLYARYDHGGNVMFVSSTRDQMLGARLLAVTRFCFENLKWPDNGILFTFREGSTYHYKSIQEYQMKPPPALAIRLN